MKREIKFRAWDKKGREMWGISSIAFGSNDEILWLDLDKEKAYNKMMKHKAKKKELAQAICDYIMVAREDFLIELVDLINKEEDKTNQPK